MSKILNWPEIVAFARDELLHGFETFDAIEFTEHDAAIIDLGDSLNSLEEARPAGLRRQAIRRRGFDLAYIDQAFSAGQSPDGLARHHDPYNQLLLVICQRARSDLLAFDALALHATTLIADGRPLIPELGMFVIDVLQGKLTRPNRSRGNKPDTYLRNQVICWVITALCEKFHLRPTRNDEAKAGHISASDAVAEAMVAMRRRPYSYAHIKGIWHSTQGK